MARKFRGWFTASELIDLDAANGDTLAVLFLNPSSFALLGRFAEILRWKGLIENDVEEADYKQLIQGMYMQMGYTHDLSGQLEELTRVVDDVRDAIDTLNSTTGQVAQGTVQTGAMLTNISSHTANIANAQYGVIVRLQGLE